MVACSSRPYRHGGARLIPAAAYLIFAEQTRRLCLLGANADHTRRIIRKLVMHFAGSSLPESWRRIAEANLALVDRDDPETYALRCLSAVARIEREENQHWELLAKFDGLDDANAKLADAIARLTGGAHAK